MNRVIITGGSGFLAPYVAHSLRARGFDVVLVSRAAQFSNEMAEIHRESCDSNDFAQATILMKRYEPTHLLNLGWYTAPGKFWSSGENLRSLASNLVMTQAFVESGGSNVVSAGSCAEYLLDGSLLHEGSVTEERSLYATSKAALRRVVNRYLDDFGVRCAWGRLFYVYGPGEPPDKFVSWAGRSLLNSTTVELSQPDRRLDYIHVKDAAAAYATLVDSVLSGDYNVCSASPITPRIIVETMARNIGFCHPIREKPNLAPSPQPDVVAAPSRLLAKSDWNVNVTEEDGLKESIDRLKGLPCA